jgi:SAM-dependent methyltransferase
VSDLAAIVRTALEEAISAAEQRGDGPVAALDAGCGRRSALSTFRARLGRLVGADIHVPAAGSLPDLDEFAIVDLCRDRDAFPEGSFDVVLSSFTVEHFADPRSAFVNMRSWLRPGGRLVMTTVNRRHPFVAAYLSGPRWLRTRLQGLVKAAAADAHPLVGACNTPTEIEDALVMAGFDHVHLTTVGHLEAAWKRRTWARLLGRLGDRLTAAIPTRRSTIVALADRS